MKTKVELKDDVQQSQLKKGDKGYIDGYLRAADNRGYAVVVVGERLDFVPLYSLKVIHMSVTHRTSPNTYVGDDMKNCKLGLYEIFWKIGGSSIALIGNMHNGVRWVAPTNWTSESDPTGRLDDKMIDSIERIVLLYSAD